VPLLALVISECKNWILKKMLNLNEGEAAHSETL
jgi:hypothetical protein